MSRKACGCWRRKKSGGRAGIAPTPTAPPCAVDLLLALDHGSVGRGLPQYGPASTPVRPDAGEMLNLLLQSARGVEIRLRKAGEIMRRRATDG